MCGIAGFVGLDDKSLLRKMCNIMKYRGPNDAGYYTDKGIALGSRRLSIIDIAGGRQPIHNEDESIWVIFNGEIYNFRELRDFCESKGHKFYTNTDTEVIVHLYEILGDSLCKLLRGMFAFALWDSNKQKLLLARDMVGEKPLYYTLQNDTLFFASEIKCLLQNEEFRRKINFHALYNYLSLRYVPTQETIFSEIKKLPPGHILVHNKNKIAIKKYWDFDLENGGYHTENFYLERLERLLKESVKVRLISDVPLGVFLSGGIDSSLITGLMSQMLEEPVKTFSVGFNQPDDELNYAKMVSNRFDTEHYEFVVDPKQVNLLPKLIWHLDEPLADATIIPTYLISELAKKHATVVLVGEGSDELFSSYVHEKMMILMERYKSVLPAFTKLFPLLPVSILNKFFEYPSSMGIKGKENLIKILLSKDLSKRYSTFVSTFNEDEKEILFQKYFKQKSLPVEHIFKKYFDTRTNLANKMLLADLETWLPNYILLRLDKMTMANSIEGRAPFLDHKLIEFSFKLPMKLKLNGVTDKYILRKLATKFLPKKIAERKKRTFITPMHLWGEKELLELSEQLLFGNGFFNKNYITELLNRYKTSKLIVGRQLWTLITFVLWHKIFIENKKPNKEILE
ncbi:MAG: asparagine synthase (glutamine-hydrolyzing) [Candidatus Aenigmarchaeota archaeon]|nr:asparagine synthase (glutamine-hydrolyzing) [Candidatus Aenigmarchaeota archaeon]